jgi:hypothetical protein
LVLDVSYTVKPQTIEDSDFTTYTELGDLLAIPAKDATIPTTLSNVAGSTKYTTALSWKRVDGTDTVAVTETTFTDGEVYKAVITITPKEGYTFVGSHDGTSLASIKNKIASDAIYLAPDTVGSPVIALSATDISVDGFLIDLVGETAATIKTKDKLVVTLTFPPAS